MTHPQELREKVIREIWRSSELEREDAEPLADRILALLPSPQGSRSPAGAEGSNPPSSPPVLEGDETLREALEYAQRVFRSAVACAGLTMDECRHGLELSTQALALLPLPRPQAPVDGARCHECKGPIKDILGGRGCVNWNCPEGLRPLSPSEEGAGSPKGSPGDENLCRHKNKYSTCPHCETERW